MHQQNLGLGAGYGILAAFCFTLMSLCVKVIGESASVSVTLFFRFGVSLVLIIPFIVKDFPEVFKIKEPLKFYLRSIFMLLGLSCFFYALKFISLTNALVLNNTAPFFVPMIAWFLIKAETHLTVWIGILLGFIGVVCILKPGEGMLQSASLIALLSGVFGALSIFCIRMLSKTSTTTHILFYNFSIGSLLSGALAFFTWQQMSGNVFLLLLAVGVTGALYQLFSTLAFSKAPVRISSSFMFLCILFGAFADWMFWRQVPRGLNIIGIILVIIGGLWVVYFGKKHIIPK